MQIIVLGMHRSGTSAVARLLNLMGAYFGGENIGTGASAENEKGFWERLDVRALNDSMLHNANCDWDRIAELDLDAIPEDFLSAYHRSARDIVLNLDAHRPWFIKEPRLCVLLPLWRPVLELPFCVHVFRHPVEVAHSLKARNGIPIKVGFALWEAYNTRAIEASSDLPRVFVSYSELLSSPQPVVDQLRDAMSTPSGYNFRTPSLAELTGALDNDLRHHRYEAGGAAGSPTKNQLALYELLIAAVADGAANPPPLPRSSLNALRRYESSGEHLAARMHRSNARQRANVDDTDPRLALKSMELDQALKAASQKSTALSTAAKSNAKLTEELNKKNTDLALKNDAIERLTADVDNRRNVLAKRDERIRDLTVELERRAAALAEKEDALGELRERVTQLGVSLNERDADIKNLTREVATLSTVSEGKDHSLARLTEELAAITAASAAKDDSLALLRAEAADLKAASAAKDDSLAELQASIIEAREATTAKEHELARLATDFAEVQEELATKVEASEQLSFEVRGLETRTTAQNETIDRLTAESKERQEEVISMEHTVRRLTTESRHLRSELDLRNQSLAANSVTVTRLRDELSQLQDRTERAVQRITGESVKLADENRHLKRQGELAAGNATRLKTEVDALRNRHRDLMTAADAVLRSRRWRVGNFLLSLRYRLLFRRVPPMATDTIKKIYDNDDS